MDTSFQQGMKKPYLKFVVNIYTYIMYLQSTTVSVNISKRFNPVCILKIFGQRIFFNKNVQLAWLLNSVLVNVLPGMNHVV